MKIRTAAALLALLVFVGVRLPAATTTFPVDELKPGMVGIGKTVFQGDQLQDFKVHILGVLRNVIGTRRNLILARLEGGPLADTGVIAGMSGSPVYIDGRIVGAVSYSLGQFSKEPIAGITPFDEMVEATAQAAPRRQAGRVDLQMPLTSENMRASLRQAFSWMRPFAENPNDVQVFGNGLDASVGTMLRPIATPLTIGGFDASVIDPLASAFREQGFLPMMAGAGGQDAAAGSRQPLRPGDPIGVALVTGDLEFGATGTVTEVDGNRVYAFGHPFYGLGPTQFPMTRAYVHTILPSLFSSSKLASTGEIIGTMQQDRATAIAGTLGAGPTLIPINMKLTSDRGTTRTFKMSIVNDQLFTPLLAYVSILNTLSSYERQNGAASYAVRGTAMVKKYGKVDFEDLFTGDTPSIGAAAYVVGPINFLLRNAFEDVDIEGLNLEIDASEQSRRDHPFGAGRDSRKRAWQRLHHGDGWHPPVADGSARSPAAAAADARPAADDSCAQSGPEKQSAVRASCHAGCWRRRQGRIAFVAAAVRAGGDGIGSQRWQLQTAGRRAARGVGDHYRSRGERRSHADAVTRQ